MRRLALALLLVSASCDGGGGGGGGRIAPFPFIAENDVEFIDAMVPRLIGGVEMTDHVLARGERGDVRALAQAIQSRQLQEIHRMRVIKAKIAGTGDTPLTPDPQLARALARLEALSGDDLDAAFLEEMIAHHGSNIDFSHRAAPWILDEELQSIAAGIYETNARQIGAMIAILKP